MTTTLWVVIKKLGWHNIRLKLTYTKDKSAVTVTVTDQIIIIIKSYFLYKLL